MTLGNVAYFIFVSFCIICNLIPLVKDYKEKSNKKKFKSIFNKYFKPAYLLENTFGLDFELKELTIKFFTNKAIAYVHNTVTFAQIFKTNESLSKEERFKEIDRFFSSEEFQMKLLDFKIISHYKGEIHEDVKNIMKVNSL